MFLSIMAFIVTESKIKLKLNELLEKQQVSRTITFYFILMELSKMKG